MARKTENSTVDSPSVFDVVRAELQGNLSLASSLTWQRLHIELSDFLQAQEEPTSDSLTLITAWCADAQGRDNYLASRRLRAELHAAGANAERFTTVFQGDAPEARWTEWWFASLGLSGDDVERLVQSRQHPVVHVTLDLDLADVQRALSDVRNVDQAWLIAQPQCIAELMGVDAQRRQTMLSQDGGL